MARYDLYRNGRHFLLDVQADTLDGLNTRIVVPLQSPEEAPSPGRRLNPTFEIEGARFVMVTQYVTALHISELKDYAGNLNHHHDEIVAALDMLFQGF